MPAEHHDSRTSERIEAFLEGPPRPVRKRLRAHLRRPHRPILLETIGEWHEAARREGIRVERYGRPATVLVLDATWPGSAPAPDALAADPLEAIHEAVRHQARETDHVTRVGPGRFLMLLPETGETEADQLAERLRGACTDRLNGHGPSVRLRVEAITPGHGRSLADALTEVERRLAD